VSEILLRWEEAQWRGQALTAEELCRSCPEHLEEVRRRLAALEAAYRALETTPPEGTGGGQAGSSPPGAGDSVPGYEILGELGRGGMGVVYQARQVKLNRLVALKMILAGGHAGAEELARFTTEAQAIARLQHPHIVQIHEVGEHHGRPFFSLEFCPGGSLEKKLAGTPLPPTEAAGLVEKLARAMHAAHQKGVVHRDLKPANVLLAEGGTPKVTDFGLAKQLDEAGQTASGAVMGTPSYMAPEQARGMTSLFGPATDVYALGAVLYECLTGRPPFKAATVMDTLRQVLEDEPVPPGRLSAKVPRDLETICLKCLEKVPARRYGSALELAEELGRFLKGEPIRARPVCRRERLWKWVRRHPAAAALITVSALAVFSLLIGGLISNRWLREAVRRAERNRDEARKHQERARANFQKAVDAVNRTLKRLGEERLRNVPEMDEVREEFLRDALEFYLGFLKDKDNPDPEIRRETAGAYERVALIQGYLGRWELARENFRQALTRREQLAAEFPSAPEYQSDLANNHYEQGWLYLGGYRLDLAEGHLLKARRIWTALTRDHPKRSNYANALALALNALGNLYSKQGQRGLELKYRTEALAIWTPLAKRHPKDSNYQFGLAMCHYNLGVMYLGREQLHQGQDHLRQLPFFSIRPAGAQLRQAQDHLRQARAVFEPLAQAQPKNTQLQHLGACCLEALGSLYYTRRVWDLAEECFQEGATIRGRLAADHPGVPEYQERLANSHYLLAACYQRIANPEVLGARTVGLGTAPLGAGPFSTTGALITGRARLAQAETSSRDAIAVCTRLVRKYPQQPKYPISLAMNYNQLGTLLHQTNRPQLAEPEFRKARQLVEPLVRKHPDIPEVATVLAHSYFCLALLIQQQKKQEAITLCTRAIILLEPFLKKEPRNHSVRRALLGTYGLRATLFKASHRHVAALADLKRLGDLSKGPAKQPPPKKPKVGPPVREK
jgi:serine/threonine-protein kinase